MTLLLLLIRRCAVATCYRCIFIIIKEVRSTNKHNKDCSNIPTRYRPPRRGGDPCGWDSSKPGRCLHLSQQHYIQGRTHRLSAGEKNVKCQQFLWKTANQAMDQSACLNKSGVQTLQGCRPIHSLIRCGKLDSLQASSKQTSRFQDETPPSNDENHMEGQGDQQRDNRASKPTFYGGPAHQENLRWTGHAIMPSVKHILFSQLPAGELRGIGRPRLRYKDTAKRNLKLRQIEIKTWPTAACQRAERRTAVTWKWRRSLSLRDRQHYYVLYCFPWKYSACLISISLHYDVWYIK